MKRQPANKDRKTDEVPDSHVATQYNDNHLAANG